MEERRLVDEDFDEESLSDHDNTMTIEEERSRTDDTISMIKSRTKTMGNVNDSLVLYKNYSSKTGECSQVVVFLMIWAILIGIGMLVIHIVARHDVNRQTVQIVALSVGWISLSNLFAFTFFIVDRFKTIANSKQMSNTVALMLISLGGFLGGWLGVCFTAYKPAGGVKFAGFFGKALIATAIGIAIDVFFILRIVIPYKNTIAGIW